MVLAVLILTLTGAAALSLQAPACRTPAAVGRARPAVCVSDVEMDDDSFVEPPKMAVSWQEELETLLAPDTPQSDREIMLKDLLARGPEIAEEVQQALQSRDLGSLLPESSKSKQLIDDIAVVQRQVVDDILPQAASEAQSLATAALSDGPALAQGVAERAPALFSLFSDPARALTLVQQEARNAVTRTPEGLETPAYRVVRQGDGYEVREYPSYGVVSTPLAEAESELVAGGRGFNALASFFLGGNANADALEMTTPVRMDVGAGSAKRMAFVLPSSKYPDPAAAPAPTDGAVALEMVEAQTLAVKEFTGFATAAEARRQRDGLLRQLQRDGAALQDATGEAYAAPPSSPQLRRHPPPPSAPRHHTHHHHPLLLRRHLSSRRGASPFPCGQVRAAAVQPALHAAVAATQRGGPSDRAARRRGGGGRCGGGRGQRAGRGGGGSGGPGDDH